VTNYVRLEHNLRYDIIAINSAIFFLSCGVFAAVLIIQEAVISHESDLFKGFLNNFHIYLIRVATL